MRKFLITVNEKQYEVEVDEIKSGKNPKPPLTSGSNGKDVSKVVTGTAAPAASSASGSVKVNAPMPGSIYKINVNKGDLVTKGQSLLILEAMKMENEIKSPKDGKVVNVLVAKGQSVNIGQTLVEIV
jgi:biotin carboxyl carrier protein